MSTRVLVGVWNLALLLAVGSAVLVFTSDHESSPWATASLSAATGLAFVGAGLVAWARRPDNRTGVLLVLAGFSWFVGALEASNLAFPYTVGAAFDSLPFVF